ncbi:hypothetical protein HNV11_20660 [Spirosoma taeanense]|uniref:Uncharacterized protein n=1 Tax=Spirosoma taeanense TaxID=2735870 RepID=A0A6M5YCA5_9BACT|nr:hypothetical protein [Spirosoma taeanense]QJW91619.1 hypothetical protein HNV11_20660 [Spirosoma taeanense]
MNSLSPWVALTEMLLLLSLAFLMGRTIAWFQYRRQIQAKQQAIRELQALLKKLT